MQDKMGEVEVATGMMAESLSGEKRVSRAFSAPTHFDKPERARAVGIVIWLYVTRSHRIATGRLPEQ